MPAVFTAYVELSVLGEYIWSLSIPFRLFFFFFFFFCFVVFSLGNIRRKVLKSR